MVCAYQVPLVMGGGRFEEHVTLFNIVSQAVLGTKVRDTGEEHPLSSLRRSAEALHSAGEEGPAACLPYAARKALNILILMVENPGEQHAMSLMVENPGEQHIVCCKKDLLPEAGNESEPILPWQGGLCWLPCLRSSIWHE